MTLLFEDVARHAARTPTTPAVVQVRPDGSVRTLSFGALATDAEQLARGLRGLGVAAGDAIAYQLPNRLEFVTLSLAALRVGAACMPLMPILRERELRFMLGHARARVLVVPATFRGRDHAAMAHGLAAELPDLERVVVLDEGGFGRLGGPDPAGGATPDAIAQILFTSGSTGEPKGVLHRHAVLQRAVDAHAAHFGLTGDDVIYAPSPLAHQTGFLYGMWLALALGATLVTQEAWDAEVACDAIGEHGVTFVQAATPFLADLVRVCAERPERPLDSLRMFVATGAAIPRELALRARTALDAEVGGGFGTTESCMGAGFVPGVDDERAWTTDGRALAGVTLRIVDDDGRQLPPGTEGNFELRTDTLFDGYLDRPQLTAEALSPDGWYRSGDLATLDADGYLRITGRVKDVINRGGEKIPVAEIEQLLYAHPAVAEVAIVAMPDPRLGERACAFVVLAGGSDGSHGFGFGFAEMQAHLDAAQVAKPYWPERLELVDALPRTPSGKIQKFVLRDRARQLTDSRRRTIAT